jgi:hypothetical protein
LPLQTFDGEGDDLPLMLARGWAEASMRLLQEASAMRKEYRALDRAYERMDIEGLSESDLLDKIRRIWIAESMLVHAASSLEIWMAKLYRTRRRKPRPQVAYLRQLRNALEHLEEADFDDEGWIATARTAQGARRGIGALPEAKLEVGLGPDGLLFGVIAPAELHSLVDDLVRELDRELDEYAQDWFDFISEDR